MKIRRCIVMATPYVMLFFSEGIFPQTSPEMPVQNHPTGVMSTDTVKLESYESFADVLWDSLEQSGEGEGHSSLKASDVLSEALLSSDPCLLAVKEQQGDSDHGNGAVDPPEGGASYQLFSEIPISVFKNATYRIGDTIAVYTLMKSLAFNDGHVNLVKQSGSAVVKSIADKKMSALLFEMSDPISGNELIASYKKGVTLRIDTFLVPEKQVFAKVFTIVEETVSHYPMQKIILDKGSAHGIRIGDVFAVYDRTGAVLSVIGIIIHTGKESSTLLTIYLRRNTVAEGDSAVLLRRAKFCER